MEGDVMVRDLMSREYVGVSESDTVLGAVQLMRDDEVGSVVVLRGSDPVGIVTEWDVLTLVADEVDPAETTVESVMSSPVLSIPADSAIAEAAGTMSRQNIRRMLVTNDDDIVGVLTERDIIAASASLSGLSSVRSTETEVKPEPGPAGEQTVEGTTATTYSSQSICEVCGSLTRDLSNFNGQLICSDCREI